MYYPEELIEEIRTQNDIVDVISTYVPLKKKGNSYFGLCPFHNEKTASFSVSRQKQMYYCFGCGAGGNVFTFLMEYENDTFKEAVEKLAERVGIVLPTSPMSGEEKRQHDFKERLYEANKQAAWYYYQQLKQKEGQPGYIYLKKRGLSDGMITRFGLGYAGRDSQKMVEYLRNKGFTVEELKQAGLVKIDEKRGAYDRFFNRVMFPIMDQGGKVIGFGGRVMGDGQPKYLNSPETQLFDKSRTLYGLNLAKRSRKPYMVLCEGYMDVIALHMAGIDNAVASLGTALTQGHASILKRYVKEVYLTYDSDGAGIKAALRAGPILKEAGIIPKVISLAPYKDPDELISAEGQEGFLKRIEQSTDYFIFGIDALERQYKLESPEEKTKFIQEVASRLARIEEEIERDIYTKAVAKKYQVGYEQLKRLMAKMAVNAGEAKPIVVAKSFGRQKKKEEDGILLSQKLLLTWLIEHPKLYFQVEKYVTLDDFTNPLYQQVAKMLFEQCAKEEICPASIVNHFSEEEEHRQVAALFHAKINALEKEEDREKAVKDTILRMKQYRLDKETKELEPTDLAGLQRLVKEKQELEKMKNLKIQWRV